MIGIGKAAAVYFMNPANKVVIYENPKKLQTSLIDLIKCGCYHGASLSSLDKKVLETGQFVVNDKGLWVVPLWRTNAERVAAQWGKRESDSVILLLLANKEIKKENLEDYYKIEKGVLVEVLEAWRVKTPWIEKIKE